MIPPGLEKARKDRMSYMIPHPPGQVPARVRVREKVKCLTTICRNKLQKKKLQTTPTLLSDYNQLWLPPS